MFELQIQPGEERIFESLDLDTGTAISMEDNNPYFAKDIFPGTFSMPLTVPPTPRNQKLFRFADLLHRNDQVKTRYPARLFGEGLPLLEGEIILRSTGSKGYRVNFQSKMSLLGAKFNDVQLKDLGHEPHILLAWDEEDQPFATNNGCKFLNLGVLDLADLPNPIKIKINGKDFESIETDVRADRLQDLCDKISAEANLNAYFTPDPLLAGEGVVLHIQTSTPGLEVPLSVSADEIWKYNNSWFEVYHASIKTEVNKLINAAPAYTYFPMFRAPAFFSGVDGFTARADHNLLTLDGTAFDFTAGMGIVPMYHLFYILEQIRLSTGIEVDFFVQYPELIKLMLFNTNSINFFENIYNDQTIATFANVINPADHMPDMSINEFLLAIKGLFGVANEYDPDNAELKFFKMNDLVTDTEYTDHTSKADPAFEIEYKENPGLVLGYKQEEGTDPEEIEVGTGEEDYRVDISTVKSPLVFRENAAGLIKIPVLGEQEGGWYGNLQEQKAVLALYAGMVTDISGNKYIQASQSNTLPDGTVFSDVSLEMEGPAGIYETFLRKLGDIYAYNEPMKRVLSWNMADLMQFSYGKKYRIDQVNFMITKISYSISSGGLRPVTAEVIRVD